MRRYQASFFTQLAKLLPSPSATFLACNAASLAHPTAFQAISRQIYPPMSILQRFFSQTSVNHGLAASSNLLARKEFITLDNIRDNKGATHSKKILGRGVGSGLGKTSGRGHKGHKARSGGGPRLGFEGGQTPLRFRVPKRGFTNQFKKIYSPVNLDQIQEWIDLGRLDPNKIITMKELRASGAVGKKIVDGIKLLGRGKEEVSVPMHIEVSQVSASAKRSIEKAGGSVTKVYYNKLGLRALLMPEWFPKKRRLLPRAVSFVPPKYAKKFDRLGDLPPSREIGGGEEAAVGAV